MNTIIIVLAVVLEVLCGVRSSEKFATSDNFFWNAIQHDTLTESTFSIWFHSDNRLATGATRVKFGKVEHKQAYSLLMHLSFHDKHGRGVKLPGPVGQAPRRNVY